MNNIVYELKNGKGLIKEYNYHGKLEFEGEYLNGKRNGKGKEYYPNYNLMFEGEFLNGKRWKGKGYNYFRKEEFEIKDGKGFVREFDNKGALISEGKYLNGNRIKGEFYDYEGKLIFINKYLLSEKN